MCCGQFALMSAKNTCILPVLLHIKNDLSVFYQQKHTFTGIFLCIRYIGVWMYLAICYPTYFRVAIVLHHPRALIRTPSCTIRSTKCTMTEFTSKNANILTLNPYNICLAGSWFTKFMWDAHICI
jgi:hypothetical protein